MSKDTITVSMNVHDIPIVVEALEEANKEIERLNSIIKEVREELNKLGEELEICEGLKWQDRIEDILEILDKVGDEK